VPEWANKYVGWAYQNGYTNGVSPTEFGKGNMYAKSYLTLMLRSLGYKDSEGDFSWDNAIAFSNQIGLVSSTEVNEYKTQSFLRDDVAKISYDILSVERKDGIKLATYLIDSGALDASKLSNIEIVVDNTFDGYTLIGVDGGDLSGYRQSNVVVDVGFGEREYWAFTNEHGQLVKVIADEIILQNDSTEQVTDQGRYYPDEAKVPGTESSTLDEGHIIADSLGGVANAYNITPQESTLNRYGDQAYMEKVIRDAGGCSDFTAIITYPDTTTQIPSHYSYTYTLMGNVINDEFDNVNPDDSVVVEEPVVDVVVETVSESVVSSENFIIISKLDKEAEYVIVTNNGTSPVNISGWRILSEKGLQDFYFPSGTVLGVGASFKVTSKGANGTGDFIMANGYIWNNDESDPAVLFDASGVEVDRR
jgi:hypothetical protein